MMDTMSDLDVELALLGIPEASTCSHPGCDRVARWSMRVGPHYVHGLDLPEGTQFLLCQDCHEANVVLFATPKLCGCGEMVGFADVLGEARAL